MTVKEVKKLYERLERRITNLENAILNHCSTHTWDRIIQALSLIVMVIVILLLKFKIL